METSLHNTANEVKEKERATQEALAHVNQLSTKEGEHMATQAALQKENKRLVCRIEELEASNQHLSQSRNVPRPQPVLSDDRATALQQQLEELQKSHQRQTSDLRSTAERLQRAQLQATQLENEGMATQKKLREEIQHMREALEEKEEELGHLQNLSGGIEDREQQLLRRIEEEEARVQTLEFTIRHQADELKVKGNSNHLLRSAERRVESEARKVEELQSQLSRLRSDLEKAEDRAAKGDTTVHEVSSRMTQLERTHRGVMQENRQVCWHLFMITQSLISGPATWQNVPMSSKNRTTFCVNATRVPPPMTTTRYNA
jgi:predicted  nucleic acid-binding Zn-ribbon protein